MAERWTGVRGYVFAVLSVAAATCVGWPLYHYFHLADTNILMLYLLAVVWIATRYTRGPAILTSVLGVAAFDYLFVRPYYTFTVADQQYLITFTVMLTTALVISALTLRLRAHARQAQEAWERVEAEFLRNTLLSAVSHDLRTPLASITGASSALLESGESLSAGDRRELMSTITGQAERMERLINNLLDMTRLEAGGLVLKREWQPLQEVVGSALRHLDRRLRGRSITTAFAPELPLVRIDAVAIEQVLVNVLDNAVEYTPAGSGIDLRAVVNEGQVVLEIADHGPGLPAGAEERIFEKFFRYHPDQSPRGGIGLGLAICRGIVEAHGGTITARNEPGGGAVFRMVLPLEQGSPKMDSMEAGLAAHLG
jgi:two-component system sensor histidine kinase KdpD